MNQTFNPIFAFNKLFEGEDRQKVSSWLMSYPVLWELISFENIFLSASHLFGSEIEKWTPINIIQNIDCLVDSKSPPLVNHNQKFISLLKETTHISATLKEISNKRKNKESWEDIFQCYVNDQIGEIEFIRKWGLILMNFTIEKKERNEIEDALTKLINEKSIFLAVLLKCYQCEEWISDFLTRSSDLFSNNPGLLKKLILSLEKMGGQKIGQQLALNILNNSIFINEKFNFYNLAYSNEKPFEKLENINYFRFMSAFIKDIKKTEFLESFEKDLLEKTFACRPVRLYCQESNLDDDDLFSLDKYFSISDNYFKDNNRSPKQLKDLLLAFNLVESDQAAAREICKSFIVEIEKDGINNVIFSKEEGYLIDPIDVAKLLINAELESEAILFLEKTCIALPNNWCIIKFLAHYSNLFGDHNRAITYFSKLTASRKITREEKIVYCKSLEYSGLWEEVLSIRKTINPLNAMDELDRIIAAHKAKKINETNDYIKQFLIKFPKDKMGCISNLLFQQGVQEGNGFDNQLNILIKESHKDILTIGIIEEYLREKGEFDQIILFLNDLPGKYKINPEIQLFNYRAYKKNGNMIACDAILRELSKSESIIHQEIFEEIIQELLERKFILETRTLLKKYREKWKLSPIVIFANSIILLAEKRYLAAKDQILLNLSDDVVVEDFITVFGCCLLETSLSDFPYSQHVKNISTNDKNKFQEIYNRLPGQKSNLINKLLLIEICADDKEEKYLELISNNNILGSKDNWRIPLGLGNLYFGKKKFDQAITYFKEALKSMPSHKVILDLLIQSYCQIKLPKEAINVIVTQSIEDNLSLNDLIRYSDILFEYDEFNRFLTNQEATSFPNPIYSIALAKIQIKKGDEKAAEFQLSKIESGNNLDKEYLPPIAQCYLDCEDKLSSLRILEKHLSMKRDLDTNSILQSASIYYQLEEYEKSLNLIKSIKDIPARKSLIEADILNKLKKDDLAAKTIQALISNEVKDDLSKNNFRESGVKIPQNWAADLPQIYSFIIDLQLGLKNYKKALELAYKGMNDFPENKKFKETAIKISYISGENKINNEYLENYLADNFGLEINFMPIIADRALENGQEIIAAKIISEINSNDSNLLLDCIQARLLIRNDQEQEANSIYKSILEKNLSSDLVFKLCNSDDLTVLINYLAICDTAYELGDLSTAFEIIKRIQNDLGLFSRGMAVYLKIIVSMLERNIYLDKLMIKNNTFRITEDDLNVLDIILNKDFSEINKSGDWKIRAMMFINGDEKSLEKVAQLSPNRENIGAIIFSLMMLGKKTEAEKALYTVDKNEKALFVKALLDLEEDPEKSLTTVLNLLKNQNPRPEYYAILSKAYEKLGQYFDGYSAIVLALNLWPNEFEWENFAGQLSKKLGNNLAAVSHFRKAESYNKNQAYSTQLDGNSLDRMVSIHNGGLHKILTNTPKDIPLLIEIINSLLVEDRDDEIGQYLNKLKGYQLSSSETNLIEARIAFKNKNIIKCNMIVDSVLQKDSLDLEALKLKAKIIAEQEDFKSAILFLDSIDINQIKKPADLIIQKAEYLAQISGIESEISFLINELINHNNEIDLVLYTAQLIFSNGDPLAAQRLAEDAISTNADNAELLFLLGDISRDLGDLDKAIDYMVNSIKIDPFQGKKYIQLSFIFEVRRDNKRALDTLYEGLNVLSDDYSLLRYTGLLLYKQGNYKAAHSVLIKAYNINSKDSDLERIIRILENSLHLKNITNPNIIKV